MSEYIYRNSAEYPMIEATSVGLMGRIVDKKYFIIDSLINELQHTSINIDKYEKSLTITLREILSDLLIQLEKEKMIEIKDNSISFTTLGLFFGNNVIADIVHKIVNN